MLQDYRKHVEERAVEGIPPKPLNAEQVAGLVELIKNPPEGEADNLLELLSERVPPGVDEAAYVKAGFLSAIVKGEDSCSLISKEKAIELLGNMHGGYNIVTLVELLDDEGLAPLAAKELKHTLLMFDAYHDVEEKHKAGNEFATDIIKSWAEGEWFTSRKLMDDKITYSVFKVTGETNTDDLSPAPDAWSRPDIPLHALAAYKMTRDGLEPEEHGVKGPMKQIEDVKTKVIPLPL